MRLQLSWWGAWGVFFRCVFCFWYWNEKKKQKKTKVGPRENTTSTQEIAGQNVRR